MNGKRITGFLFIILAIVITISNINITGAVTGTSTSNLLSLVALVFTIIGIVLLISEKTPEQKIEDIIEQYKDGQIDSVYAVAQINKIIPIQGVKYRTGKQHTILGERNAYPIDLKTGRKAEELAMTEYLMAAKNNPLGIMQSNIEIKKGLSTKHYMKEFKKTLERFKTSHSEDLETILGISV
ncbi:MAG: hypothetical protein KJ767_01660 [Nanoarchaeota archaeon]|nr:hypothetical protein [Nanoarchaeota archaeon]